MNNSLIKQLRGDAIAYRPSFAKVVISKKIINRKVKGEIKAVEYEEILGTSGAIYLQQMLYWSDKGIRDDGFVYKSKDEIYEETGVTESEQDRLRIILVTLGCLETKLHRANGSPTLHYKLNLNKVAEIFLQVSEGFTRTSKLSANVPNSSLETYQRSETITETTPETTPESSNITSSVKTKSQAPKSGIKKEVITVNPSSDITSMLMYFYHTLLPGVGVVHSPTNRKVIDSLITTHGLKDLRDTIDKAKSLLGVQYAPQISNISVFATKYLTIKNYKPKITGYQPVHHF